LSARRKSLWFDYSNWFIVSDARFFNNQLHSIQYWLSWTKESTCKHELAQALWVPQSHTQARYGATQNVLRKVM